MSREWVVERKVQTPIDREERERKKWRSLSESVSPDGASVGSYYLPKRQRDFQRKFNEWKRIDHLHLTVNAKYSMRQEALGYLEAVTLHIRPPKEERSIYQVSLIADGLSLDFVQVDFTDRNPGSKADWATSDYGIALIPDDPVDVRAKVCSVTVVCGRQFLEISLGRSPELLFNRG